MSATNPSRTQGRLLSLEVKGMIQGFISIDHYSLVIEFENKKQLQCSLFDNNFHQLFYKCTYEI
jgi:hypothetical protein